VSEAPGPIVIGFDGSDSGEDSLALGLRLVRATGARRLAGEDADYRAVGSGSPAHGLDHLAESEGASLIVVGSTRHGPRRRMLPGSTGERLLHGAACPVAVARRALRERSDGPLKTIDVVDCLAALDDRDVDLLMCGSRGYGPVRRVLLGGFSARLIRQAASPVVVVPRGES
jgi:nucleotide-binding universal stress UspA family protein